MDGHSTDQTVAEAKANGARVITDRALGKGDGLKLGVEAASHPVVIFLDADGSHDPHDIPRIAGPVIRNEADMVIGSRMTGGSDELSGNFDTFVRFVSSQVITLGINLRWKSNLSDSQNGFRAIKRQVFLDLKLRENRHTIEQEMLMRALKKGYKVSEVPAHEYKRVYGKSHIRLSSAGYRYFYSWIKGLI